MLSIITEELKKYRENDDDDNIGHHSKKKLKLVEGIYDDDDIGYYSRKKLKSVESITGQNSPFHPNFKLMNIRQKLA
ncbi:hypothetical protein RirG_248190 [Rhizophagus irregularis DAOM 197198w]|uniref:Uncharacterized protein n=1 Tax=Rhizophagus irregularis (strain DAOM 197198w) TaxID=1432141 RepID=A0A015LDQ1_RHIIW|nr:hypothetical protein RirG_248190 [Rhizophagus irregularis DAOM 197198w]